MEYKKDIIYFKIHWSIKLAEYFSACGHKKKNIVQTTIQNLNDLQFMET